MMEFFVKIAHGFLPLIIFEKKNSTIDVWQRPKYGSSRYKY